MHKPQNVGSYADSTDHEPLNHVDHDECVANPDSEHHLRELQQP